MLRPRAARATRWRSGWRGGEACRPRREVARTARSRVVSDVVDRRWRSALEISLRDRPSRRREHARPATGRSVERRVARASGPSTAQRAALTGRPSNGVLPAMRSLGVDPPRRRRRTAAGRRARRRSACRVSSPSTRAGFAASSANSRSSVTRPSRTSVSASGSSVSAPAMPGAASAKGRRFASGPRGSWPEHEHVDRAVARPRRARPGGRPRRAAAARGARRCGSR